MVLSDDTPGARWTSISTLPDVKSSTFRIFIFPFSLALTMESHTPATVFP